MEKRDNEIFMQSPDRRYLAMQGKLLRRASTSVKGRCRGPGEACPSEAWLSRTREPKRRVKLGCGQGEAREALPRTRAGRGEGLRSLAEAGPVANEASETWLRTGKVGDSEAWPERRRGE